MIYGKLTLEDWRTATVMGEEPESSFESDNLRLFFYGTLYNRDALQTGSEESNAELAADAFLTDAFSHLDGSFTIIYYSATQCGIVRDHHGTHYPVYCAPQGDFATSWKLLEEHSGEKLNYNRVALSTFLQRGVLKVGQSGMEGVALLEAGQQFHLTTAKDESASKPNKVKNDTVFCHDPKMIVAPTPDIKSYSRQYGRLHTQAIRRRIGDSRRVGILLSGGYDSGANLAALRNTYDGSIDSYSVGFKGDTWTELPLARLMSDTFGTRHHEYEIDGSEIKSLPDIVRFLGEPFVEGGLMVNYCAMRMIGDDKPDVILGGDGSDQYFGTSGREVALHYITARTGMHPLLRGVNRLLSNDKFDTGGKLSRINFHLDKILHVLEGERFGFSDSALRKLLLQKDSFQPEVSPISDLRSFEHLYTQHALIADLEVVINRLILYKASRMAGMFNNNLTFPFMDLDLFNFLQNLPVGLKCRGDGAIDIARGRSVSKFLLKHHYKPLLPEAITSRRKQGGFAPMPLFFSDRSQRDRLKEFILSSSIYDDYLCRDGVEKFLTNYDLGADKTDVWFWHKQNKALQYFQLLTLVTWWEIFVCDREVKF